MDRTDDEEEEVTPAAEPRLPVALQGIVDVDDPQFPDLDAVALRETEVSFPDARILTVLRSRLVGIALDVGDASLDAQDAVLTDCDLTSRRIEGLRRVRFERCRLTGADLSEARVVDVTLDDCAIDLASFRAAHLERVQVNGGRIDGTDLTGADLAHVRLTGLGLTDLVLDGIRMRSVDLRGADVGGVEDLASLRGATIDVGQALELAPRLARAVGLRVLRSED